MANGFKCLVLASWLISIEAIATNLSQHNTVIAETITIPQQPVQPSLWWLTQRLNAGWVENIAIDTETRQATITINTNRWTSADYLQRFSFLFKLGNEAQKQDFNVMLSNRLNQKVAEYSAKADVWRIDPKTLGAEPFRVIAPTLLSQ
ncbi:MAG: hypothetical protein AUK48_10465 [Oscillatoriales cyanobacterium CG2_30_44_21]|nr:MAG: hypothetical protein AUK48_10465 [Oscillatoriales cyanobacterium CG2_30_44_21]